MTVTLQDGLEEIGEKEFDGCTSLHEIVVLLTIKVIKKAAFYECSTLRTVTLHNGLEEIGEKGLVIWHGNESTHCVVY
jgi:hypothetical protein